MNIEYCYTGSTLNGLVERLTRLDPTQRWKVAVTRWKSKRSIEQNSRYWKLITELANYTGDDKDRMHDLMGYKFLREVVTVKGEEIWRIKSTTELNTKEMAELQDSIERWAHDMGFYFEG
jgi:hypothetical protein